MWPRRRLLAENAMWRYPALGIRDLTPLWHTCCPYFGSWGRRTGGRSSFIAAQGPAEALDIGCTDGKKEFNWAQGSCRKIFRRITSSRLWTIKIILQWSWSSVLSIYAIKKFMWKNIFSTKVDYSPYFAHILWILYTLSPWSHITSMPLSRCLNWLPNRHH